MFAVGTHRDIEKTRSGVIAFCAIPGLCGVAASGTLELKRRPLLRDIAFYTLGLACLVVFFADGRIGMHESLALVCLYFIYVAVVVVAPSVRTTYRAWRGLRTDGASFVKAKAEPVEMGSLLEDGGPPADDPGSARQGLLARAVAVCSLPFDLIFQYTMPSVETGAHL